MVYEMPKADDLIKDRENLQQKVAAIQAQKNKDIEDKIKAMEGSRDETKKLEELLSEGNKNLEYYEELEKSGQLPENELENFEKAKQITVEIKTKITEHDTAVENTMAIPDVKDRVIQEAGEINKDLDRKKAVEEKTKMLEEKYYKWYEKLADMAEELNKKQREEKADYDNVEKNLIEKINNSISDGSVKGEIQKRLKHILSEKEMEQVKKEISQYREKLGWVKFFEKGSVDSLINSIELKNMEEAVKRFGKFIKDNELEGRRFGNFNECAWTIFHNNMGGIVDEFKTLEKLQHEKPSLYSDDPIDKAYKKANRLQKVDLSANEINRYIRY